MKLSELTTNPSLSTDDLIYVVNDPAGSPYSYNTTITNLIALFVAQANTWTGLQTLTATNASTQGLIVKGYTAQSANLTEWQNSSGNILARIKNDGGLIVNGGGITVTEDTDEINPATLQSVNVGLYTNSSFTALYGLWANSVNTYGVHYGAGVGLRLYSNSVSCASISDNGQFNINNDGGTTAQLFVNNGSASRIGLIVKGASSQTANLAEFQNSAGTPHVTIGPSTLSDSPTNNFFRVSGTLFATGTNQKNGVYVSVTGAGTSSNVQRAMYVELLAGFTGATQTQALSVNNSSAGTGANYNYVGVPDYSAGNIGSTTGSLGATNIGANIGCLAWAALGRINVGLAANASYSQLNIATSISIGVHAKALRVHASAIQVGGYFGLISDATIPTLTSAALIADNGTQTSPIFIAQDNGTAVFTINDGSTITSTISAMSMAQAFSIGSGSTASSYSSLAIGTSATASTNSYALAIGTNTTASGTSSIALGYAVSSTTNNYVFTIGSNNSCNGAYSTSIGYALNNTGANAVLIGNRIISSATNTVTLNTTTDLSTATTILINGIPDSYNSGGWSYPTAKLVTAWISDVTATRTSRLTLSSYYTTTAQEGLRIDSASDQCRIAIGGNVVSGNRATIYAGVATDKGLVVQGAASHSANLAEFQNSSGTPLASITSAGVVSLAPSSGNSAINVTYNTNSYALTQTITAAGYGGLRFLNDQTRGLFLGSCGSTYPSIFWTGGTTGEQGAVGYSGNFPLTFATNNLQRMMISGGGLVSIGNLSPGAQLHTTCSSSSTIGLIVQGAASQTANLAEFQNSAGTPLASITSAGVVSLAPSSGNSAINVTYNTNAYALTQTIYQYGYGGIRLSNDQTRVLYVGSCGSSMSGPFWAAGTSGEQGAVGYSGNFPLTFATNNLQRMMISGGGLVSIGNLSPGAQLHTTCSSSSTIGLIVQGAASQTANLAEFQNSSGTSLIYIDASGLARAPNGSSSTPSYSFLNNVAAGIYLDTTYGGVNIASSAYGTFSFGTGLPAINIGTSNNGTFSIAGDSILQRNGGWGSSSIYLINTSNITTIRVFPGSQYIFSTSAATFSLPLSVVAASASTLPLTVKAAASQTANLAEFQNSSGTPHVTIGPSTLTGSSASSNFFNITGTLPSTQTADTIGVRITITGAGSSSYNTAAMQVNYNPGSTQPNSNATIEAINQSAGTAASGPYGYYRVGGNFGIGGISYGTTAGTNFGVGGTAQSANMNVGVVGNSIVAKNGATNIAVAGFGLNTGTTPIQIGGFFGLMSSGVTFTSAALIADNGTQTSPIFIARDNGTAVFTIADDGLTTIGGGTAGTTKLIVKGAAAETANLAEFQNSAGTPHVKIGPSTLPTDGTKNFLNVTGTTTTSATGAQYGVYFAISRSGAAVVQEVALRADLLHSSGNPANFTAAIYGANNSINTGTTPYGFTRSGNHGGLYVCNGSTAGANIGVMSYVANSSYVNFALAGQATVNASGANVAVIGLARNGGAGAQVGGYFALRSDEPAFTSCALVCNNSDQTSPIFIAQDNGTAVFSIADGGGVNYQNLIEANTAGSGSPNILVSTESGTILTNEGATAENYHTLPTAVAGYVFEFICQDADGIRVVASTGDTIRDVATASSTAGYIRSSTIGSAIKLVAINATEWIVTSKQGTWTIDS